MQHCALMRYYQPFPAAIPQYKAGYPRVTHPSATNLHIARLQCKSVRLACVRHAASVHPEPGSNSHVKKFFPASFIWHCLLLIRVASRSFDRSACSWISLKILEFSGLHYCLFVKDHNLLLRKSSFVRCCCSQRQLWYLIITAFVCQQLFLKSFSSWKTLFSVTDIYTNISVRLCQQLFLKSFQVSFELLCCLGAASTTNLSISPCTPLVNIILHIFQTILQKQ